MLVIELFILQIITFTINIIHGYVIDENNLTAKGLKMYKLIDIIKTTMQIVILIVFFLMIGFRAAIEL
jgi:hypothetical protein